jgi:hypothetical protein
VRFWCGKAATWSRQAPASNTESPQQRDQDHGPNQCHHETANIEAVYSAKTKKSENPTPQTGSHDTDDDIEKYPLTIIGTHDERRDPPDQPPKNNVDKEAHTHVSLVYYLMYSQTLGFSACRVYFACSSNFAAASEVETALPITRRALIPRATTQYTTMASTVVHSTVLPWTSET